MRHPFVTFAPDGLAQGLGRSSRGPSARYDRARGRLADLVLAHLPVPIAVLDQDLRLLFWNAQAGALWGRPPLLAVEHPPLAAVLAGAAVLSQAQRDRLVAFCADCVARGEPAEPDTALRLSVNRDRRICAEVRGIGRGAWMLSLQDSAFGGVAERAGRDHGGGDVWLDALTGLPNRRQALQAMHALPADARHALLLIDVMRLDRINDAEGRVAGDTLLCLIGRRLSRELRQDDMPARLGGGTFSVLALNGEGAEPLAKRLLAVLSQPYMVEGKPVRASFGIGVAAWAGAPEPTLRGAEAALLAAKSRGPNPCCGRAA